MENVQVYCINLKKRPDRWTRFIAQRGVQEIKKIAKFERFEAVDGKEIDVQNDDRISVRTKRNILYQMRRDHEDLDTVGGIGCYLSHAAIWKKFLDSGDDYCIVLEDDALVPDNFVELFGKGLVSLRKNVFPLPDMWQLSTPHAKSLNFALGIDDIIYTNGWAYDVLTPTTGYVLFKSGADILLKNAFPIDGHVDLFMNRLSQISVFRSVHYKNLVLYQVAVKMKDSNIQAGGCELCNVPTNARESGFIIIKKEQIFSTALILGGISAFLLLRYFK
jgi:GR25 family glycosyltransferase involved in LPS biosynthesis